MITFKQYLFIRTRNIAVSSRIGILLFSILLGTIATASPLAQSMESSSEDYFAFLKNNRNYKEYAIFLGQKKEISKDRLSESLLSEIRLFLENSQNQLAHCNAIQTFLDQKWLSLNEVEFLGDFLSKVKENSKASNEKSQSSHQKSGAKSAITLCLSQIENYINPLNQLYGNAMLQRPKIPHLQNMNPTGEIIPGFSVLLLNGQKIDIDQVASEREALGNNVYRWQFFSNRLLPIEFVGSYEELKKREFHPEPLVDGTCQQHSFRGADFEGRAEGSIFFSNECIESIEKSDRRESSTLITHSKWIIPASLILGAMVYYLQDHRITIGGPSN